jgi:hypothetical protein
MNPWQATTTKTKNNEKSNKNTPKKLSSTKE